MFRRAVIACLFIGAFGNATPSGAAVNPQNSANASIEDDLVGSGYETYSAKPDRKPSKRFNSRRPRLQVREAVNVPISPEAFVSQKGESERQSGTRRLFGSTGMQVGPLGLGGAEIGFERVSDQTVDVLLGIALDAGINVIDTAAMYDDSEEKIGKGLAGRRDRFLLFTKCGRSAPPVHSLVGLTLRSHSKLRSFLAFAPQPNPPLDWHPRALKWNIEQSLRRLRTDYLDLIQIHTCPESLLRDGAVIEVLERAQKAGKVRYIGYSGDGSSALYALRCGLFDTVQLSINIADQEALNSALPLAVELGVGVVAKRPIANGLWKNTHRPESADNQAYWDRLRALRYDFVQGDGERAFEIALRFTLSVPGVHTAIVGTANPEHLLLNVKYAAAGPLAPREFDAIRARWKQVSAPHWLGET
jgi:aryl-alcohol dehydrogenase-like predicted oxidoreductase